MSFKLDSSPIGNLAISNNLFVAGRVFQKVLPLIENTGSDILYTCKKYEHNTLFIIPEITSGTKKILLPTSTGNTDLTFKFCCLPGAGNTIGNNIEIVCNTGDSISGQLNTGTNGTTTFISPINKITILSAAVDGNFIKVYCTGNLISLSNWYIVSDTSSVVAFS